MNVLLLGAIFLLLVNQDIGELGVKINVLKTIARIVIIMGFAPNVSLGFGDMTAGVDALLTNVWNAT
jgi:hypothetical protein